MVRRGKKPSKGVANKKRSVGPLSPEERSVLDKVSACPIVRVPIQRLRPSTAHARLHSDAKIIGLVAAIRCFGFVEPILVDQDFTIISGVARWMACQEMGVAEVPVIVISHLSPVEVRALRIALGRFPEWATWDRDQLRVELPAIIADLPDLSMQEIGFTVPEVDRLIAPPTKEDQDPADEVPEVDNSTLIISRLGDLWRLGQHLLLCGDALESVSYDRLLGSTAVRMVLTDPPATCRSMAM
jgi:hypothetical protein